MRVRSIGVVGLLVVSSVVVSGCKKEDTEPHGRISGVVVDLVTQQGIGGVQISAFQEIAYTTTTNDDGTFTLVIADTEAMLTATVDGYKNAQLAVGDEPTVTVIEAHRGESTVEDNIALARFELIPLNGAVGGTVRYNGEAATGAVVGVWCADRFLASAESGGGGTYAFSGLEQCVVGDALAPYTVTAEYDFDDDGIVDARMTMDAAALSSSDLATVDFNLQGPVAHNLNGFVFVDDWSPAAGADVLLRHGLTNEFAMTTTAADGSFDFDFGLSFDEEYTVFGAPYDIDGDGWVDTGPDVQILDWTEVDRNVVLSLPGSNHSIAKSNVCDAVQAEHNILPGESLYFLFDGSVNTDLVTYEVLDPMGAVVPTSESWLGNYLLEVSPNSDLVATSDPQDIYTVRFYGIVFEDGFVSVDPADPASLLNCRFSLSAPAVSLPEPTPGLYLDAGQASAVPDAGQLQFLNATGNVVATSNYAAVELAWPRVAGALAYKVFARQTNGDVGNPATTNLVWTQLGADVGANSMINDRMYTTVNLAAAFNGGLGGVFDLDNEVSIIVKPVDENGHWEPVVGDEAKLVLSDGWRPEVNGGGGAAVVGETGFAMATFSFRFTENMDLNVPFGATSLVPFGGRITSASVGGSTYWGSLTPSLVTNTAFFPNVTLAMGSGSRSVFSSGNGDRVYTSAELGSFAGYAVGQQVGIYDSNPALRRTVYGQITGLNTSLQAMTTSANYTEKAGDVLFDPCASRTWLTAEALDGTSALTVVSATGFFVGQRLEVGPFTGAEFPTIASISGTTLTLTAPLANSHEVNDGVNDAACFGGGVASLALRDTQTMSSSNNRFVGPTSIGASTSTLTFTAGGGLNGVVVGDWIWIDGDNNAATQDDQISARITQIQTIDATGVQLRDANLNNVQMVTVTSVTAHHSTVLPLAVDPSELRVYALADGFSVSGAASFTDTSGNGPVNNERGNVLVLQANGSAFMVLPTN